MDIFCILFYNARMESRHSIVFTDMEERHNQNSNGAQESLKKEISKK